MNCDKIAALGTLKLIESLRVVKGKSYEEIIEAADKSQGEAVVLIKALLKETPKEELEHWVAESMTGIIAKTIGGAYLQVRLSGKSTDEYLDALEVSCKRKAEVADL